MLYEKLKMHKIVKCSFRVYFITLCKSMTPHLSQPIACLDFSELEVVKQQKTQKSKEESTKLENFVLFLPTSQSSDFFVCLKRKKQCEIVLRNNLLVLLKVRKDFFFLLKVYQITFWSRLLISVEIAQTNRVR